MLRLVTDLNKRGVVHHIPYHVFEHEVAGQEGVVLGVPVVILEGAGIIIVNVVSIRAYVASICAMPACQGG